MSSSSILNNRYFVICFISAFVTLPLSLLRNISKLAKTSFLSCFILMGVLGVMIVRMFTMNDKVKSTNDTWAFAKSFDGTTDSFSILVFAFMCHHNSFLIFNSMSKPTINNWNKVVHTSVLLSLVISMAFGLIGYFTFTGLTQGIKII